MAFPVLVSKCSFDLHRLKILRYHVKTKMRVAVVMEQPVVVAVVALEVNKLVAVAAVDNQSSLQVDSLDLGSRLAAQDCCILFDMKLEKHLVRLTFLGYQNHLMLKQFWMFRNIEQRLLQPPVHNTGEDESCGFQSNFQMKLMMQGNGDRSVRH